MKIGGFMKLTLLDFPGSVACILFTQGCNFKCSYCHNSSLIKNNSDNLIDKEYIINYLKKRKGILDGVSISGGEPLIQPDIKDLIKEIKELGYKIKIDTNGSKPEVLKELIANHLLDYVAMDIKNSFERYEETVGIKADAAKIKESIKILENSDIEYEFRTTVVKQLHTIDDIETILREINKKSVYYIQNFNINDQVPNKKLSGFSGEELRKWKQELEKKHKNIKFRDI